MFGLAACTGSMTGVIAEAVEGTLESRAGCTTDGTVRDDGGALGDLLGAASSTAETITEDPSGIDKAAAATVGDPVVGDEVGSAVVAKVLCLSCMTNPPWESFSILTRMASNSGLAQNGSLYSVVPYGADGNSASVFTFWVKSGRTSTADREAEVDSTEGDGGMPQPRSG